MRIAGEIVNSRSAAADLTQSRSTRSATRRLDTKAGDSYCSLSPARPFEVQAGTDLSEELPKKRRRTEVLVSSNWQPWCLSAGTFSNNDLGFLTSGAIGIRIVPIRAPVARGVLAGEHRVRYRRCLRWGGQKRTNSISLKDVTPKPWTGSGCPPLPRAPRRPEQLSKWPQERAVLKLVL